MPKIGPSHLKILLVDDFARARGRVTGNPVLSNKATMYASVGPWLSLLRLNRAGDP